MEWKFQSGIWKMPEWNGIFQEWNGRQSSVLSYNSTLDFVHGIRKKHIQMSGRNDILTEILRIIFRRIVVFRLCVLRKQCTY